MDLYFYSMSAIQANEPLPSTLSNFSQDQNETDSLLKVLLILGQLQQVVDDLPAAQSLATELRDLPSREAVKSMSKQLGLRVAIKRMALKKVTGDKLPLAVQGVDGEWFLLAQINEQGYLIQRPREAVPQLIGESDFANLWRGRVLRVKLRASFQSLVKKFDIAWFLPELARYKRYAAELLIASAVIQLFALVSPLFFQVVMDKVLVHNTISTLDVLVIVLVSVAVFEILLTTLRQYMATQTATRIDARLGGKLYRHLVDLPLSYFSARPVGVTVMRVNELNSIREFITGAANTLIVDLGFTFIFFSVMYFYSPLLTLIVAASIPCFILVAILVTGPLQKKLEKLYQDGAINNAFLTEVLNGVETVKALALEAQMVRRWEYQTRDFVHSNYKVQHLMQLSANLVMWIKRVTLVLVLWVGARKVIGLELSIGQLIAFNMMANHVMQPIIRLTELWRDFVQARISVERLGDVLNTLPEVSSNRREAPDEIRGAVVIDSLHFRYDPTSELIFQNFSLRIPAGTMVAFVGHSGSGKSTLTRLIQKLYVPERGRILIDDIDVAELNPVSLRQQMSVVLQENFLFNRSVRDNIAITDPAVSFDRVIEVAKLAGAHEFILELKDGYDTILAEGGLSLSGGQRQRVAIARALLNDPSILIFDEATSALDDFSQSIIQKNMQTIRAQRSIIMVAHRLSTVRECDCIFVLDKGTLIEYGNHNTLIQKKGGAYKRLWDLQRLEMNGNKEPEVSEKAPGVPAFSYQMKPDGKTI